MKSLLLAVFSLVIGFASGVGYTRRTLANAYTRASIEFVENRKALLAPGCKQKTRTVDGVLVVYEVCE